jgi:predicted ATPase
MEDEDRKQISTTRPASSHPIVIVSASIAAVATGCLPSRSDHKGVDMPSERPAIYVATLDDDYYNIASAASLAVDSARVTGAEGAGRLGGRPPGSISSNVTSMLDRVSIKGFKSFDEIDITLGPLSLLVGPNGAGKSNFIQVFELLGEIIRGELELSVGMAGGASALLHATTRPSERIEIEAFFASNGYDVSLVAADDDSLVFEREVPWYIDSVRYTQPFREPLGAGHRESRLPESEKKVAKWVLRRMSDWFVYHFHDTGRHAPVKRKGNVDDNDSLRNDASNLAAFLYRLRETDRAAYDRIVDAIRSVAPFFDDFRLRPDRLNSERIQLEWTQRGSTAFFGPNALSDGTLRFVCIATLLLQPTPPSLILLDEPELGLHPYAINLVAEMLEACAQQIIVSTQSVTLLNRFDIESVVIAEQVNGASSLVRPDVASLDAWLGEYGLGELWEKNLIGGRPVQH